MMNQQQSNFANSQIINNNTTHFSNAYLNDIQKKINDALKIAALNQDKEIQQLCNMIIISIKDKIIFEKFDYYD